MKPETENWLKIARYELKVAESLLKDGFFLKVKEFIKYWRKIESLCKKHYKCHEC